jgi:hypothetical protein
MVSIHERGTLLCKKAPVIPLKGNKSFIALYEFLPVYPKRGALSNPIKKPPPERELYSHQSALKGSRAMALALLIARLILR